MTACNSELSRCRRANLGCEADAQRLENLIANMRARREDERSAAIRVHGRAVLDKVGEVLAAGDEYVRVEGHTDDVPIGSALHANTPQIGNWPVRAPTAWCASFRSATAVSRSVRKRSGTRFTDPWHPTTAPPTASAIDVLKWFSPRRSRDQTARIPEQHAGRLHTAGLSRLGHSFSAPPRLLCTLPISCLRFSGAVVP